MVDLIDPKEGRVINTSSGAASMYLKKQDAQLKTQFSDNSLTFDALEASVKQQVASGNIGFGNGYGLSKAALSALTIIQGNKHPNLKVVSLSPGFIDTPMTKGCFMSLECTLSVTILDKNGPPFLCRMSYVYRHAHCANRLPCIHAQIGARAHTHTHTLLL